jgi:cob(I)alamin adenosyltransferase
MAVLGIVQKKLDGKTSIKEIGSDLYKISGLLAGWEVKIDLKNETKKMEVEIERGEKEMEKISKFLKPGKDLNVWLNWARVVCRRTERRLVTYSKKLETRNEKLDENILIFINRLSDYLFILSRRIK